MILLVGGVEVFGAIVHTTISFQDDIAGWHTNNNLYRTPDFTLDGEAGEGVYVVGISMFPDGEVYINVVGFSYNDGTSFKLYTYGEQETNLSVLELYVIIDGGDGELFYTAPGIFAVGSVDDVVLTSDSISIEGGAFGDISDIDFTYLAMMETFSSVAIDSTIPEPATIALLGLGCLMLRRKR